jgi:hypothetical protein
VGTTRETGSTRSAEAAEAQIGRFIEHRHEKRVKDEGGREREPEAPWTARERRARARRRRENASAWWALWRRRARFHARRAAECEAEALKWGRAAEGMDRGAELEDGAA